MYILDTNACIRILNNSSPDLSERLRQHKPVEIHLCSIVKAELIYGAYLSERTADNLRLLDRFFEPFTSLPFNDRCSKVYGRIRSDLARNGQTIGPNDMMIAAITVTNEMTLVSANTREFGRVPDLLLENWEQAE